MKSDKKDLMVLGAGIAGVGIVAYLILQMSPGKLAKKLWRAGEGAVKTAQKTAETTAKWGWREGHRTSHKVQKQARRSSHEAQKWARSGWRQASKSLPRIKVPKLWGMELEGTIRLK